MKRQMIKRALCAFALLSLPLTASAIGLSDVRLLPERDAASNLPDPVREQTRTDWSQGSYGMLGSNQMDSIRPFGSHLFNGGFSGNRADGLNDNYKIVPGDQITLRIWGAIEIERMMPVDAQGNIFIPSIGPIQVQGLTNSALNGRVTQAVRAVYPENVSVYTNLQGVQPVAVYVTGFVTNPGRYAGTPSDSMLYFLDQAGGIDDQLGSYRSVRVLRNQQVIARADLYDFLLKGELPRVQFRDGDTIVVEERGPSVVVTGDVERQLRYELQSDAMKGQSILQLARLKSDVSHVLLRGARTQGPVSIYVPINEFPDYPLQSGDEVLFSADQRDETIVVQIEGSFYGPSRFALPRDARLVELLDAIAVPQNLTDVRSISIRRESVAERQKSSLMDSLRRLENTYLGASSSTNEEANIRVREAELIAQFVAKARQVEPTGRLVVAHNDQITDIRLQDRDIITLPEISDSVLISGEVLVPQSVVYQPGMSAMDYIRGAGGFTQHADNRQILVVRLNGEVRNASEVALRAGDEILVLPKVPTKNLQLATSVSQILANIAIVAKIALDL